MTILGFIYCGVAFAAGAVVGVYMAEQGLLTSDQIHEGGKTACKTIKKTFCKTQDGEITGAV